METNFPCKGYITKKLMNLNENVDIPKFKIPQYMKALGFGKLEMDSKGLGENKRYSLPFGTSDLTFFPNATGDLEGLIMSKRPKGKEMSCAIVGSGSALLGKKRGQAIDNHSIVIRFNRAPTKGYEEDVGARTDIRVVYPETWMREDSEFMLFVMYKNADAQWLDNVLEGRKAVADIPRKYFFRYRTTPKDEIAINRSEVAVLSPNSFLNVQTMLEEHFYNRGRRPTSGCLILALAASICASSTLFGFGLNGESVHYYNDDEVNDYYYNEIHDMRGERLFQKYLKQIGRITVDDIGNNLHKRNFTSNS